MNVSLAYAIADLYFAPGMDRDDMRQEALIALLEAERTHQPELGPFEPWARLIVSRKIFTIVKTARRMKRGGNENPVSLDTHVPGEEGECLSIVDVIHRGEDPTVDKVAFWEAARRAADVIDGFSELEANAYRMILNGDRYQGDKQADNAIVRVRRKLEFVRQQV